MPYITQLQPEPNAEIVTGITNIGGVITPTNYNIPQAFSRSKFSKSEISVSASLTFSGAVVQKFNKQPFNKGISSIGQTRKLKYRLLLEIADNSSYADSNKYTTKFYFPNEKITIQHPFTETGKYYIKLQAEAEDSSLSKVLEYTINIIILKYFIEEPQITRRSPQANTVIVKSNTSSATASTFPQEDNVIKRIVEIDEGDASVCQAVADELISRWGSEQKSVQGKINLTVTLDFKQKVRFVNKNLGLDEIMILQKKSHNVGEQTTEVIAGDIILDDNELLTRILDDMKG